MVCNDLMLKMLFVFVGVYMHAIIYSTGFSCIGDQERKYIIVHVIL